MNLSDGRKKWLGCYDNQKRETPHPHEPESCTQSLSTPTHHHHHHHHQRHHFRQRSLRASESCSPKMQRLLKEWRGPIGAPYLIYDQKILSTATAWGTERIAGPPTQYRHQRFISTPQAHCAGEASMAATLTRAPFSSSLFNSEEESGWRRSRKAVEGASAISPSLPVFNSLMKFRSEEQRCKHSRTVEAVYSPVCFSMVV